jgi:periplasmic protein TonB
MLQPVLLLFSLLGTATLGWAQGGLALRETDTITASEPPAPVATSPPASSAVYYVVEQMPVFPGGMEAFQKFLRSKLQYPEEALRQGISGKVHVRFLVTEEGHIHDAQVVRGLGYGLDAEALRLVRIMPWWTPGRNAGCPVRVMYTIPIVFRALD